MANNISVISRLARDAKLERTTGGTAVLKFTVADDVGFGDKKTTNWWDCQLWGKQAEGKLSEFLKKGTQVVVFGEASFRPWETKEGEKRVAHEIRVTNVQLVGSRGDDTGHSAPPQDSAPPRQQPAQQPPQGSFDDPDEDIPF